MSHDCKQKTNPDENGDTFYIFLCSRCKKCYVCEHEAIYNEKLDRWQWRCADGNIRKVILDGRLK